ncbi:hypothetical protein FKM82_020951 [Ascaphus truei]
MLLLTRMEVHGDRSSIAVIGAACIISSLLCFILYQTLICTRAATLRFQRRDLCSAFQTCLPFCCLEKDPLGREGLKWLLPLIRYIYYIMLYSRPYCNAAECVLAR